MVIKYKISFFFSLLLLVLIIPKNIKAIELNYFQIINLDNDFLSLKLNFLEAKRFFLCNLQDFLCVEKQEKEIEINKKITSRNFIKSNDYSVSYSFATSKNKNRIIKITDLKNKKGYFIKSKVNYWDLLAEEKKLMEVSPNGQSLIYLNDASNFPSLDLIYLNEALNKKIEIKHLVSGQYTVKDFIFYDFQNIFYIANKENPYKWSLYKLNLENNNEEKIIDQVAYSESMKISGDLLIFFKIINSSSLPQIYDIKNKLIKDLTFPFEINKSENEQNEEVIKIDDLYGVLAKPTPYFSLEKNDLIIWLHGGPHRQNSLGYNPSSSYATYDWILNKARENNFLVFKLDYTGSSGYGRKFAEMIKLNVGKKEVADVLKTVDYFQRNFNIGKIYLAGNSYGGYLSLRTLVEKPSLFAGAFSINGVTNWEILLRSLKNSIFNIDFNGVLNKKNKTLYKQASIFERINKITDQKIYLIHNQIDKTIDPNQSRLLYYLLLEKKKLAKFYSYDDGHSLNKKETVENVCRNFFEFLSLAEEKALMDCAFK